MDCLTRDGDVGNTCERRKSVCVKCNTRFTVQRFGHLILWRKDFHATPHGLVCFACYLDTDWMKIIAENIH
jgi:hypothetical protein